MAEEDAAEEAARGGPVRTPGALAAPTALASSAQPSAASPASLESSQEMKSLTPEEPSPLAPSEPAAGAGASELAATDDTAQMLSHELSTEVSDESEARSQRECNPVDYDGISREMLEKRVGQVANA